MVEAVVSGAGKDVVEVALTFETVAGQIGLDGCRGAGARSKERCWRTLTFDGRDHSEAQDGYQERF